MMALSLSQSRYYKDALPALGSQDFVYINNTSSVQLDIMRPDMLVSGLEAIVHNQNQATADLQLFEFGRVYFKVEDEIQEKERLSVL